MSYKLETLKINPGGLNLLMPADSPTMESLDLTDWWPGAAGRLEQAPERTIVYGPETRDGVVKAGARTYSAGGGSVYLEGASIDSGYGTAYPVGMISFQGYAWFTSQSKQAKANGSTVTAWTTAPPAQPAVADAGLGSSVGTIEYTYFITYVIPQLGETNPSPVSDPITPVSGHGVNITAPTFPTGTPATGWNIYRRVPGYGGTNLDANTSPYLLNPTPINIGLTVFHDTLAPGDNMDDESLLRLGVILEANHDPAPAAAIMANQVFNGRIVVANSVAHPNRMWWTQANEPAFFRGSGNDYGGDWVDVGTDSSDPILAIIVRPGMLVIYRAKSIWRHIGDFEDAGRILEPACPDIGIAGARAVASTAIADYFVGSGGEAVYSYNNDWPTKLSQKIEPVLRGMATENFSPQDLTQIKLCAVGHHRGRLYVSYMSQSGVASPLQTTFILHIESARWFAASRAYQAFYDAGDTFLAGAYDGLYKLESAYPTAVPDLTTNLKFQTQYIDCGFPDREKTFADLVIPAETRAQNLTVIAKTNKGTASVNLPSLNVAALGKQIIPLIDTGLPIRAFNISIRITGSGATASPILIDSPILLHYYLEARRAKLFDSGNTNHGLEGVGVIDQVELDIEAPAGISKLVISSDIPGGLMTDRTSGGMTVAATLGRMMLRLALATPVYGRLFRHQLGTTTDFQLYGYKVRILPVGVFLDGANPNSEFWYTLPLSPGVG